MVKRLFNSLLLSRNKVGSPAPSTTSSLQLPEHPDTPIELKRTRRKKSIAFQISNNQIKVLAPKRLALYRIQQMLHKRSGWIGKQLEYQASLPKEIEKLYMDGTQIHYLGRRYRLNITTTQNRSCSVQLKSGKIELSLQEHQLGNQTAIKAALGRWYQQRAEEQIPLMVEQLAQTMGVDYGPIQIRHFKSRWGSCRADGRLQFNWRLMMADFRVLEYVITHELCHRIHLNHSRGFWNEVECHMPEFHRHQKWLKSEGHRLTL